MMMSVPNLRPDLYRTGNLIVGN